MPRCLKPTTLGVYADRTSAFGRKPENVEPYRFDPKLPSGSKARASWMGGQGTDP